MKTGWMLVAGFLALGACGSAPAPVEKENAGKKESDAPARAEAAAEAALAVLNGGKASGGGQAEAAADAAVAALNGDEEDGTVTAEPAERVGGKKPQWVNATDAAFSPALYVAAVGHGDTRNAAEKNALAALTGYFIQNIKGETKTDVTNTEEILNGNILRAEETSAHQEKVTISSALDALMGAEVKEVWYDGKSLHYAVAVMDKAKTIPLYSGLIQENVNRIRSLTSLSREERGTLEAVIHYRYAAALADANWVYGVVLSLLGDSSRGGLRQGDDYRLEARKIAQTIPLEITVRGDGTGRVKTSLAQVVAAQGFQIGDASARYVLRANLTMTPADLPVANKFVRYVLEVNLIDKNTGQVLMPYSLSGREGGATIAEAENWAVQRGVERKIKDDFFKQFGAYLSQLIP